MLNIIRMDLYRLFKTRSMYVIWLIMAVIILLTTYMETIEMETDIASEGSQIEETEPMNLGIAVEIPTESGKKVTLYDEFFGNAQGKAIALYIVIFAVLFSTADSNSGYIKNIGGQIKHRRDLILSKALSLFVYTVMTLAVFLLIQAIANQIFLGYLKLGDVRSFGFYFVLQAVLHFALALICMAVAILIRNNVISMIFAICLCMNLMQLLYGLIDKIVQKTGVKDFSVIDYTVTGKMAMLPMELTWKEGMGTLAVGILFILAMTLFSSVGFEKRDIV